MARIAKINNKYYDTQTSNKSFLQLARDYKILGVKNWYFILEIKDISLVNVNPFAVDSEGHTTLTKDQIMRIETELFKNPWYYLREIARIPDQGGTAVPYKANRGNIAQAWCFIHGLDSWLCLVRQKGKTQSALAIIHWAYSFGTTNSEMIFINKDGDNAKTNLKRLKDQRDLLPEYLQFKYIVEDDGKVVKGRDNATKMSHSFNGNSIITKPKATSYEMALSLARGLTAPILHFDEPEFTNHIKTIVSNSVSTYEQAAANAKKNGAMYGRIFTCTPGDLDTKMGQEAQQILDNTVPWTEKMYDWDEKQIQEYVAARGKDCNKIFYIEYFYYQIGLDNKWLENISAKIGDKLTVRREILLQRLHGSSLSPYEQEDIEYIVECQKQPIDELWLLDYYKFDIYTKLNPKQTYVVAIDCSTGTVGDSNAITIIDPRTIEPVAEFECSYIGETKFSKLIIELISNVIPKGVVCIERNSVGDAIIDFLLHSKIAQNLYFDKDKDLTAYNAKQAETTESILKREARKKKFYGVYTEGNSRDAMFAILARHVNEYKEKFVTRNITRDLSRLVKAPSGKILAGNGFHDDSIMSYLIGLYVIYHGNNLSAFNIHVGAAQAVPTNEGLPRPTDEIDTTLVDPELVEQVKRNEYMERNTYEKIFMEALKQSQQNTIKLHKAKMIENETLDNTPDEVFEEDDSGSIDLSFFDEVNPW